MCNSCGGNMHIYYSTKKNNQEVNASADIKTNAEKHAIAVSDDAPTELTIEMEMLPAEVIKDENALVEITDSKVLAHVNRFFE